MESKLSKYGPVTIAAVLAFGFALILWQLEKDRLALEYEVTESAQFPRGTVIGKYFIVSLQNSGNKSVDHIALQVTFDSDVIESMQFSEPSMVSGISQSASDVSAQVPLLNPEESISVTITTSGRVIPQTPRVAARAAGVTARRRSEGGLWHQIAPLFYTLIGVMCFGILVAFFGYYRAFKTSASISRLENLGDVSQRIEKSGEKLAESVESIKTNWQEKFAKERETFEAKLEEQQRKLKEERVRQEKGEPERHQKIFTLMNRAGLTGDFIQSAVSSDDGLSYWGCGLLLLRAFLTDEENRERYVLAMEGLVTQSEMAPSSKGFNLYLLGKMEQFRGNTPAAVKWFGRCRDETPLMFEHLMAQDSAFDLATLEQDLRAQ